MKKKWTGKLSSSGTKKIQICAPVLEEICSCVGRNLSVKVKNKIFLCEANFVLIIYQVDWLPTRFSRDRLS